MTVSTPSPGSGSPSNLQLENSSYSFPTDSPMLPQLLPFVSYTVFGITSTLQLKLNGLHPHPSFSSSTSRLSPAATISSGLRKQLSPAFLLCRPSQGMRTRSSNLVIHVASRREFLLRCRAVGIPSNSRLCNSYLLCR